MRLAPAAALAARLARVRARFDAAEIDALLVTHLPNVFYLTNHAGSAGIAVVTRTQILLLVDARYAESVRQMQASGHAAPELEVRGVPGSYDEAVIACLLATGVPAAGFEADQLTVSRFDWFRRTLAARGTALELRPTSHLVEAERLRKDACEVERLREAARMLSPVAEAAFGAVRAGVTEREVAGAIEKAMRDHGFDRLAFDTIVASGPNAALPHYRAGHRPLQAGDLVVLDFGGVLDGYCSDLTRTVSVGPPTDEARRVYQAVLDAQQAAIDTVRPGVTAADVDTAARSVLAARGLGDAFGHGTGHGLGLEVHELPRITRPRQDPHGSAALLEPGMVFTIEPGAYIPGWGGVRIEDDVLVREEGGEVLTSVPRTLMSL